MSVKMFFPVSPQLNITLISLVQHVASDIFFFIKNVRNMMFLFVCHSVGKHFKYCFCLLVYFVSPSVFVCCKSGQTIMTDVQDHVFGDVCLVSPQPKSCTTFFMIYLMTRSQSIRSQQKKKTPTSTKSLVVAQTTRTNGRSTR